MEEEILKKYFQDKMKQKEIAELLGVSKYKVSRVVSKNPKYSKEKERRKEENREKHNDKTKKYITKERKSKNNDLEYARLKQEHLQASMELSDNRRTMSNRAFRDWNVSAYRYDEKSESYILRKEINAGADVPKRIKWKNFE